MKKLNWSDNYATDYFDGIFYSFINGNYWYDSGTTFRKTSLNADFMNEHSIKRPDNTCHNCGVEL